MGIDVRFVKVPSFEGMYLSNQETILIGSDRPEGRKRFTCAHEIGHHVLGHGTSIDEITENGSDEKEEKEADFFATMLLMPTSLVSATANLMSIDLIEPSETDIYSMAAYFGVSYSGVLTHLYFNVGKISNDTYRKLLREKVSVIKKKLYAQHLSGDIHVVDNRWWREKAVDCVVGDIIVVPKDYDLEGSSISKQSKNQSSFTFKAEKVGISKISNREGWSAFVRVSNVKYVGLSRYRYEED